MKVAAAMAAMGGDIGGDTTGGTIARAGGPPEVALSPAHPYWEADEVALACSECQQTFGLLVRRHHCRACGQLFCGSCTTGQAMLLNLESRQLASARSVLPNIEESLSDWYLTKHCEHPTHWCFQGVHYML
jgi:hypothetical protein